MDLARLRSVGIVAHIDAGKTTVTERILFYTGVERRMGEVHTGTTAMDWMEEERERGITITSAATVCPWRDHSIQWVDTPGHVDFSAEVNRSLRVLDGAVVVICGVAGVQAQTETVLREAERQKLPWLAFVNKMDRPGADFGGAVGSLQERLGVAAIPVQIPMGEGAEFSGVVDLLEERALLWDLEDLGSQVRQEVVPEPWVEAMTVARKRLCEAIADTEDTLLESYLENESLTAKELRKGLRQATLSRRLVPVLCGAALRYQGIQPLLDAVLDWLPSPLDRGSVVGEDPQDPNTEIACSPDAKAPFAGLVFKIFHQPHGDLFYLRVYSGTLREGDGVGNAGTQSVERVGQIWRMHADHHERISSAGPGEIVVLPGLKSSRTGDTLYAKGHPVALAPVCFPEPVLRQSLEPTSLSEREKLEAALEVLVREDPTLVVETDEDTGQSILAGLGELHLEVVCHRLAREFKVEARAGRPWVAYREAPLRECLGQGVADRPLLEGGRQRVEATVRVVPAEATSPSFGPDLVADLPTSLHDSLSRDLPTLLRGGGEQGYPLACFTAHLETLCWTPEDTIPAPELALGAVAVALEHALAESTVVLEPWMSLRVEVPENHFSGVLADLQARKAEILDLDVHQGERVLHAAAPLSALFAWTTELRSLTQGRGSFSQTPAGYRPRPESENH